MRADVTALAAMPHEPHAPPAGSGHAEPGPGAFQHEPVLLDDVVGLVPAGARLLADCTVGGGGHAEALLQRFPEAELFASDRDPQALEAARRRLAPFGSRVLVRHAALSELASHLPTGGVDFLLADLGVSSPMLDDPARGFSFSGEGPLDMRMDPERQRRTAAGLVNGEKPEALRELFWRYGEERFAARIARAIARERERAPIATTTALAHIVSGAVPAKYHRRGRHPATRVFQALRIAVNDELGEMERLLDVALDLLAPGGRIAVIAFHSLEDRLVKQRFREWEDPCVCPPSLPVCACGRVSRGRRVTRKPATASAAEADRNPRSRSARLRAFEKRPEAAAP